MARIGNIFCESAVWGPRARHICLCGGEVGSQREQKSPPPQWKVNKKCLKFEKIVIEVCLVFSFIFFLATKEKPLL